MTKSDTVKRYIHKFPKHGNRTIAQLVVKEHPNLFPTLDAARSCVRRIRGNHSNAKRHQADPELKRPNGKAGEYKLPKSLNKKKSVDRKSTRLNSSHSQQSRMPSSA